MRKLLIISLLAASAAPASAGLGEGGAMALGDQQQASTGKAPWIGSHAGISEKVLPPWTPLVVEHRGRSLRISCWGRTYEFGSQPFPRAVITSGRSVLCAPIRIVARAGGRLQVWKGSAPRLLEAAPGRVRISQQTTGPDLILSARTEIEYDGMMRIDWKVEALRTVQLEGLIFEIPFRVQDAKYLYYYPDYERSWAEHRPGELPQEGFASSFRPALWLGDEERGLEWFAESDENWFSEDPNRVTEVKRDAERATIRLRLVSVPVALDPQGARPSLSYTFGLQATPVKHNDKDAWDYRTFHISQPTFGTQTRLDIPGAALDALAAKGVRTVAFHEHWTDIESYTQTTYGEQLRRLVRECHKRGMQFILYFGFLISDLAPEWQQYGDLCVIEPRGGYEPYDYPPQPVQSAYRVCYRSAWQDFLADGIARVVDEYDIDGVYLDGTADPFGGCRNRRHGCGYVRPDGTIRSTYAIFPIRSMMRRIYTIVKERKPRGQVDVHQSAFMVMPTLAWGTSYWDGEHLQGRASARVALSLDGFRTEFMGYQWGVPAEFLVAPPFNFRQGCGLALLHDVPVRAVHMGADLDLISNIWRAFDEFGRERCEWIPYWRSAKYVPSQPDGFVVSLHRHPKNGLLVAVLNTGPEERSGDVRLDLKALGLGPHLSADDALTHEPLASSDGGLHLTLASLDWRLLWLHPGG